MSNVRAQNVLVIDTSAGFTYAACIKNIKLVGGSDASTVTIKADDTNGTIVYSARAATNTDNYDHDLDIECKNGFYVTLTGTSSKAYLYLE